MYAVKYSNPFITVRFVVFDPEVPLISITIVVPMDVPSLSHNWSPLTPSVPTKNRVLPIAVSSNGVSPPWLALMVVICVVPPVVPLLVHNWEPWVPSLAEKNNVPLTLARYWGWMPA